MEDKDINPGLTSLEEAPAAGMSVKVGPKGGLVPAAKEIVADEKSTDELLRGMQQMIEQRSNPWNTLNRGLERMSAWAVPSLDGQKAAALSRVNESQSREDQDLMAMRNQLAGLQAARSSAGRDDARLASIMGGGAEGAPAAGGTPAIPADVRARMQAAPNSAAALAIRDEWLKGRVTESTKKEFAPAMAQMVDAFNKATGEYEQMTVAQFEQMRAGYPNVYQNAKPSTFQPTGDSAARVAGRESGNNPNIGFHDTSKGSAYGTYGITNAAYKDVQAANPKFQNRDITTLKSEEQTEAFNTYRGLAQNQFGKLGIQPTAQNLDLAHFLGPAGAANFIKTGTVSPEAAAANGGAEKATQIAKGILSGSQGTTGVEPAIKTVTDVVPTRAEVDISKKASEAGASGEAAKTGELLAPMQIAVRENGRTAGDRSLSNNRALQLLDDPDLKGMVGKFQTGSGGDALIRQLNEGVQLGNFGSLNIKDISSNAAKYGATKTQIDKFEQLANIYKQNELEWAKSYLKGQGSVSDNERNLVKSVVGNVTDPIEKLRMVTATMKERADFDKEIDNARKAFGKGKSFGDFLDSDAYAAVEAQHNQRLEKILNKEPGALKSNSAYELSSVVGKEKSSTISNKDVALAWAKANPKDPRAEKILKIAGAN